ncbi:MAG: Holliday junction branch migration protein RuvA [Gemmatimonadota bacterium]
MISRIRGILLTRELDRAEILTASGVVYEIHIPLTVFERLPPTGAEVELRTCQVVREDSLTLVGFTDETGRKVFNRLIGVTGVGPKLALTAMSSLSPDRLAAAIAGREVDVLRRIQGIGKKTAQRIVLELADKVEDLAVVAASPASVKNSEQAVGALVALGYAAVDAGGAVRKALDEKPELEGAELIKAALTQVGSGG